MRRLLTTSVILCLLAMPAAASADSSVNKLLRDACNDEHVDGHYTQKQYKEALDQLATDSDEYTDCRNVLERARLAALSANKPSHGNNATNSGSGGGGTTGGGGGGGGSNGSSGSSSSSGSSGSSGSGDALAKATPKQRQALAQAAQGTAKPVDVGGKLVKPGTLGLGTLTGSDHGVPTPLVALIALLAASALAGGGWWLWSRVLARRFG
jgi:cobalamin biosynthesis Mg chelatase CobN